MNTRMSSNKKSATSVSRSVNVSVFLQTPAWEGKKKKNNPTRIYVQNRKLSHWNLSSNEDPKKQARHFFFFCTVFGKAGHRYVTSVLLKLQCAF